MPHLPSFIDFEASSLRAHSYPIEVAWNLGEAIEQHLISPQGIFRWTDWDRRSEALHGIARKTLIAQGKPPAWVCARLNEQLQDQVVYSDNPLYDTVWLETLFSVCHGIEPAFRIGDYDELLEARFASLDSTASECIKLEFYERVATLQATWPGFHRAGRDVAYLLRVYSLAEELIQEVGR